MAEKITIFWVESLSTTKIIVRDPCSLTKKRRSELEEGKVEKAKKMSMFQLVRGVKTERKEKEERGGARRCIITVLTQHNK